MRATTKLSLELAGLLSNLAGLTSHEIKNLDRMTEAPSRRRKELLHTWRLFIQQEILLKQDAITVELLKSSIHDSGHEVLPLYQLSA